MAVEMDLSNQSRTDLAEECLREILKAKVTHLNLSSNRLTSLPPSISHYFSNLQQLDISSNNLTELPVEICSLHRLQILHAKHNRMKSLPRDFGRLKALKELNLSGNGLEHFPAQLCELEGLESLQLGANHIASLPPQIQKLKRYVVLLNFEP